MNKGLVFWGAVLGLFLGPLGAIIALFGNTAKRRDRFIGIGGIWAVSIVGVMLLAATGSNQENTPTCCDTLAGATPTKVNTQGTQRVILGEVAHVGDLDLVITEVLRISDARAIIRIEATNARGKAEKVYNFSTLLSFKLIGSNGIAYEPTICFCEEVDYGGIDLLLGGKIAGKVYFKVDAGITFTEVWYQSFLSTNKAIIRLP